MAFRRYGWVLLAALIGIAATYLTLHQHDAASLFHDLEANTFRVLSWVTLVVFAARSLTR